MNPYNPSGYTFAPPPKRPRPAWVLPVSLIAGLIFVVCALVGLAAFVAPSTPSAGNVAAASTPTGSPGPNGAAAAVAAVGGLTDAPAPTPGLTPALAPTPTVAPATTQPATVIPAPATTKPKANPPTSHKPSPKPPTTKPKPSTCGAPANPWGLNLCGHGHTMTASQLPSGVCGYFDCIGNFPKGRGYMVECNDHTYSMSGGISGACSSHSGEAGPVYNPN
jgi:hypothetical protein